MKFPYFIYLPADLRFRYLYRWMSIADFLRYTSISKEYRKLYSNSYLWSDLLKRDYLLNYEGNYGRQLYILFYRFPDVIPRSKVIQELSVNRLLPILESICPLAYISFYISNAVSYHYEIDPIHHLDIIWKSSQHLFTLDLSLSNPNLLVIFTCEISIKVFFDISDSVPSLIYLINTFKNIDRSICQSHFSIINIIVPFLLMLNFRYVKQHIEPDTIRYEYRDKDGRSAYLSFWD